MRDEAVDGGALELQPLKLFPEVSQSLFPLSVPCTSHPCDHCLCSLSFVHLIPVTVCMGYSQWYQSASDYQEAVSQPSMLSPSTL